MKKKRGHKRKNKKVVRTLFVLAGILVLALILLFMSSFGFFEERQNKYFDIKDECGVVLGNLIHQVRDAGECRVKCVNECGLEEMEIDRYNFVANFTDCNKCECWCE
jgi:hypothetical protein